MGELSVTFVSITWPQLNFTLHEFPSLETLPGGPLYWPRVRASLISGPIKLFGIFLFLNFI